MMNKKGITLVEFIVSIALVSVVMVFLFNLLVDVQYNSKNGTMASDNQLNRASILRTVMDDFTNLGLVGITDSSTNTEARIGFKYQNGTTRTLTVAKNYVTYNNERWSMRSKNNRTTYQTNCLEYQFANQVCCSGAECNSNACSDYFYVRLRIPVVIGRSEENTLDDLDFFYVGKSSDITSSSFPTKSYLGYNNGTCTN